MENVWTFPEKGGGFSIYTYNSVGRNGKKGFAWDLLITNWYLQLWKSNIVL